MPRRPAVLLTSPRDISNSSLFLALSREGFVLDHQIAAHPVPFQSSTHSFSPRSARGAKTPGCHQECFSISADFSQPPNLLAQSLEGQTCQPSNALSPLDATLTAELRVLTEISRSCPPTSPVESILTDCTPVTPLDATLTKTRGGGPARSGNEEAVRYKDQVAGTSWLEKGGRRFGGWCRRGWSLA